MRYTNPIELDCRESEPFSKSFNCLTVEVQDGSPKLSHTASLKSRFSGWRGGVLASIAITGFVLFLNVMLEVVAVTAWDPKDGIATAFTGDCNTAARWTTALHLLINALGSLLLGASNYCMQRLVAPTRKEIDKAHAKKKWLDIGVPSIRNLSSISKGRALIWGLLALSSLPLHFVYNSAVFGTIAANNVAFFTVTPEFFTNKAASWSHTHAYITNGIGNTTLESFLDHAQEIVLDGKYSDPTLFENVTITECKRRYSSGFITSGNGFGVVTTQWRKEMGLNASNSLWTVDIDYSKLRLNETLYDYCLCESVPQKCQVQFSTTILSLVIAANFFKVILMLLVLSCMKQPTLVTIGDSIQSFLCKPDPTTENCCLMSRYNVRLLWNSRSKTKMDQDFKTSRRPWFSAISGRRWFLSLALSLSALAVGLAFSIFVYYYSGARGNGFGKVDPFYLIDLQLPYGDRSSIPYVLLANLPQAVASLLYVMYNGLFTGMLANREWIGYTTKRAPLRVTIPKPGQRSTHFLQLPYAWSVPLLVASILLHWFISQTLFLARIAYYQDGSLSDIQITSLHSSDGALSAGGNTFVGLGYSDSALRAVLGLGLALLVICLLIACICTYPSGLGVGGTNSAVISAACHLRFAEDRGGEKMDDITVKPLQWGVTFPGHPTDWVGHCSFSSGEVERPQVGHLYAGLRRK